MIIYVLANPSAGNGEALTIVQEIQQTYPQVILRCYITTKKQDEVQQVKAILSTFRLERDRLLIVGGDGTLSKTLSAWLSDFPFVYVPTGSGNDFARSAAIQSWQGVMNSMLEEDPVPICVLNSSQGVIINSFDIGYPAQIITNSEASRIKKWLNRLKIGRWAYLFFGIVPLFQSSSSSVVVETKEQILQLDHLFFLSVANNTYFGGGIMIWPTAHISQFQLDIVYVTTESMFQRIQVMWNIIFKRHYQSPLLHHLTAENVKLTLPFKTVIQIDGELYEMKSTTISYQTRYCYLERQKRCTN